MSEQRQRITRLLHRLIRVSPMMAALAPYLVGWILLTEVAELNGRTLFVGYLCGVALSVWSDYVRSVRRRQVREDVPLNAATRHVPVDERKATQ